MIDTLLERLHEARQRLRRARLATGAVVVVTTALCGLLAWVLCDYLFVHRILEGGPLDVALRVVLMLIVAAVVGRSAWLTVFAEWRTERDDDTIAVRVERTHQALGGRLISSVQLARVGPESAMAPDMIAGLIEQTVAEAEAFDFAAIVDLTDLKRAALWLALPAVVIAGLSTWKPGHAKVALQRMALLAVEYPTATRILVVDPGAAKVVAQGEALAVEVTLDAQGYLPDGVDVVVKPADGRQATLRLKPLEGKPAIYSGTLPQVLGDLQLRPYAFDARWPTWIPITAQRRPQLKEVMAKVIAPAYLAEKPATAPFTDLSVTVGTVVTLTFTTAEPVAQAQVELVTGTAEPVLVPCTIDAKKTGGSLELPITATTAVRILLSDANHLTNPDPVSTTITAVPDAPPAVTLTFPVRDVSATRLARWPLRYTAKDDHGLGKAAIRWQIEDATGDPQTIDLGDLGSERQVQKETLLDLSRFNATPGTRLLLWIEVADRRPQTGASLKRTFTILDPEQLRQELEAARAAAVEAIGTARDRQKDISRDVERLQQQATQGSKP
jgi:hypothetical protein